MNNPHQLHVICFHQIHVHPVVYYFGVFLFFGCGGVAVVVDLGAAHKMYKVAPLHKTMHKRLLVIRFILIGIGTIAFVSGILD